MYVHNVDQIKDLMNLQGLSQRSLAVRAQTSQAFLSQLLRGQRGAKPITAWRIATALGVRTEELFSDRLPTRRTGPPGGGVHLTHPGA
ncbi:helix-turn-helix domain-containing protein [Kitasatospora sp. NPDC057904]|uniref:helix-turn-helix domain-containing protein n=1 Tax=unclassified Kitasatospora TaxID=2633591 RepID=UPI0036DBBF8B